MYAFTYEGFFAIATDAKHRSYRVMLATGTGRAGYFLEPWRPDCKIANYPGRFVWAGDDDFAAVHVGHRTRPKLPASAQRHQLEAENL